MVNKRRLFIFLFILVLGIRIFHLSFFEIKDDQIISILGGEQTRAAHFLISHGGVSGIGINNPPFYWYLMGALTFFSTDPFWITFSFFLLNLAAFIIALFYFYTRLPPKYALTSGLILAFSPAFTIYSNIIWLQSLLPAFIILFFLQLDNFIKNPRGLTFVILSIITSIAAGLHLSGFFLFPCLLLIGFFYGKQIKLKSLFAAFAFIFVFFSTYLYHLIFEKEISKFISYGPLGSKPFYWDIFRQHIRMASIDFFRYYFKRDFFPVLDKSIGGLKSIIYPLSWGLVVFFIVGIFYYLFWVIRKRKFFDASLQAQSDYPVAFQIAGFVFFTVSFSYLFLRVQVAPNYLIVFFPVYSLLTGFAVYKLWNFRIARYTFFAGIFSTLILLVAILSFLKGAGGHPQEYGLNYERLIEVKKDIRALVPPDRPVNISVEFPDKGKTDKLPFDYIQSELNKRVKKEALSVPVNITVAWDKKLMRYSYYIKVIK